MKKPVPTGLKPGTLFTFWPGGVDFWTGTTRHEVVLYPFRGIAPLSDGLYYFSGTARNPGIAMSLGEPYPWEMYKYVGNSREKVAWLKILYNEKVYVLNVNHISCQRL